MKKLLFVFLITQLGFVSQVWATAGAEIPASKFVDLTTPEFDNSDIYMQDGKCKYKDLPGRNRRSNEYLYLSNTNSGNGYEADNSRCGNNIQVCVSGYSTVSTKTMPNQCWVADVPRMGGDSWKPKISIPECTPTSSSPWTGKSSEKTPVFVNKRQKIMKRGNNIIKTIVGTNPTDDYDLNCIAYICDNGDNKFSYGCQDGSCADECPDNITVDPDDTPDNNGNNGNDGGDDGADNSSSADTPKLTPPHSAKPYKNKLKTKYKISTSQ